VLMSDDLLLPGPEVDLALEAEPLPTEDNESGGEPVTAATETEAFDVVDGIPSSLAAYLDEHERNAIRAALAKTRYNRTAAAQLLGVTFRQLRYRMQRLGIK
jgi:two-component system response regulator PilR (NtrC family)